jgi:hypothetical protein
MRALEEVYYLEESVTGLALQILTKEQELNFGRFHEPKSQARRRGHVEEQL